MNQSDPAQTLAGKLLVAMPGMGDPRFDKSVILLCAHGEDGAMGLIVNKTAQQITFLDLLDQLGIGARPGLPAHAVHVGGPVETGRGFVLHRATEFEDEASLRIGADFEMTATLDALRRLAEGKESGDFLLALGYAGWQAGQLEQEIARNGWLIADATPQIVFGTPDRLKWSAALEGIGVDPMLLSGAAGRA
ncbi:YqgE/AlgH family protein [Profundibacterium mesophilum]|uniref:UPF0301 protein PMES_01723 n=1 Tax=Profundibacterium mesophilum KAUST100406-0324 TaxID=1037889 RepID=A0A921NYS3_9RHOB|nr:YqgE/AlgH family protein [Profundibacterium mesophilum]KAF0675968.1 putative transcriptional regulator Transcription [Profundibacterium mesophilum KAUST100406-0324]